jgi:LysM repeat protein
MKNAGSGRKYALILVAVIWLMGISTQAQETNLLVNGGFEAGFTSLAGTQPRSVATGWTPWNAPRAANMASYQNTSPKYLAASTANASGVVPRVRSGNDAQIYYAFYETFDGGIYQQISGITPGTELRFSVYAYVWSTTFDDPNVSEEPGSVAFRVGVDPTGGTDALSSNVVYSTPTVAYDAYRQSSVIVRASGSTVTVFIRASIGEPVQYTYIYLDDALLSPTTVAVASTSTPTRVPPTNTTQPSATPVQPLATSTALAQPSATTAPAQPTAVPTNTPVPQDPTPTPEGGLLATATPFGLDATATAFAGGASTPIPGGSTTVPGGDSGGSTLRNFPGSIIHVVRRGDTVADIANLYGSDAAAIITANGLNSNAFIQVDQRLVVPVRLVVPPTPVGQPTFVPVAPVPTLPPLPTPVPGGGTGGPVTAPPSGTITYTVARGDTLLSIANRNSTTVGALVQLNGITNPNLIFVGQRLLVPGGPAPLPQPVAPTTPPTEPPVQTTYIVKPGDSLYRISLQFGVSIQNIARANNIANFNRIFVGQVLVIPR